MKTFNVTRENKEEVIAKINILPNMIIDDQHFFCMTTDREIAQLICEITESPEGYDAYPGGLWCVTPKEGYTMVFYSNCVEIVKITSSVKIEEVDSYQPNDFDPCLPEEMYNYQPDEMEDSMDPYQSCDAKDNSDESCLTFIEDDEIGISLRGNKVVYLDKQYFTDEMIELLLTASSAKELTQYLKRFSNIFNELSNTLGKISVSL